MSHHIISYHYHHHHHHIPNAPTFSQTQPNKQTKKNPKKRIKPGRQSQAREKDTLLSRCLAIRKEETEGKTAQSWLARSAPQQHLDLYKQMEMAPVPVVCMSDRVLCLFFSSVLFLFLRASLLRPPQGHQQTEGQGIMSATCALWAYTAGRAERAGECAQARL